MKLPLQRSIYILFAIAITFTACSDSGGGNDGPAPTTATIANDIQGDISTIFTPGSAVGDVPGDIITIISPTDSVSNIPGDINSTGEFTFYDLDTGTTISDSLSSSWDIGFSQTTIIANSGNGGGIQLVTTSYSEVTEAPTSGYAEDNGSWYTYDPDNFAIYANEGQTLLVQTPDGNYAKIEMLSYYEGAPDETSEEFLNPGTRPASRYFTFNYSLQTDASTKLTYVQTWTYYDLDNGEIVEDENSSAWDIGFSQTNIRANDQNGGGIQLVTTSYSELAEAPTSGYGEDNGSWYTYDPASFAIYTNEGQTLVVQTPDGNYAKVEMLSYYEGNPDVTSAEFLNLGTRPASRYFTFNYSIQSDGTTELIHVQKWSYFDFETGTLVEDETSSQWDIGFSQTTIRANSTNGGGVLEANIDFENFIEAPIDGYQAENGSWYTYTNNNVPVHAVLPNDGVTLAFVTGDGHYAKVRILSYYEGNPEVTSEAFINPATRPAGRYFTFEYAVQEDGSRFFE